MTVSTSSSSVTFQGNGSTTSWPYTFLIPDATQVVVTVVDTTVAPATSTVIGSSQYSITGLGVNTGGAVTYPLTGNLVAGQYITIQRVSPYVQSTSLSNQGGLYPTTVEGALDYLTLLIQQLAAQVTRSLQVSVADTGGVPAVLPDAAIRKSAFLGFDSTGAPIAVSGISGTTINAAMVPLVQAASMAAARAVLGSTGTGDAIFTAANAAAVITLLGVPTLTAANVFGNNQSLTSTDPGATVGPVLTLDRNSASPAASDLMGSLAFTGRNSSAATITYGGIQLSLVDPVAATEDGAMQFQTMIAGALATRMTLSGGLRIGSPAGGDIGAGTINASGYYVAGVQIPFSVGYDSGALALISYGSATSLTHGLGGAPKFAVILLQCVTAEAGYSTGDQLVVNREMDAAGHGLWWGVDSGNTTQIRIVNAANAISVPNKTTGVGTAITPANWNYVVRAFR